MKNEFSFQLLTEFSFPHSSRLSKHWDLFGRENIKVSSREIRFHKNWGPKSLREKTDGNLTLLKIAKFINPEKKLISEWKLLCEVFSKFDISAGAVNEFTGKCFFMKKSICRFLYMNIGIFAWPISWLFGSSENKRTTYFLKRDSSEWNYYSLYMFQPIAWFCLNFQGELFDESTKKRKKTFTNSAPTVTKIDKNSFD